MSKSDELVREIRSLLRLFHEPTPPLKTDDALRYGFEIRTRLEELDKYLSTGGQFPAVWVTQENKINSADPVKWDYGHPR